MSKAAQKPRKHNKNTPIVLPADVSADASLGDSINDEPADMFFEAPAPEPDVTPAPVAATPTSTTEISLLTQQLQMMQQIIAMQQQQMQQQLQQHKLDLEQTKQLILQAATSTASNERSDKAAVADRSASESISKDQEPPAFTSFRSTVPSLPMQHTDSDTETKFDTLHGRLGIVNDSIVAPSSRQDVSHLTEFRLGSRYVIKGLGLM